MSRTEARPFGVTSRVRLASSRPDVSHAARLHTHGNHHGHTNSCPNAVDVSIGIAQRSNAGKSVEAPDAMVGIPAFTREDLLDSSSRREDIVAVVRAVLRHLLTGSIRFNENEPFAQRAWIGVHEFPTHLSLGIERTDAGTEPQLWAWLSVHDVTPFSDVVVDVLDELFPGEAVDIPKGMASPSTSPLVRMASKLSTLCSLRSSGPWRRCATCSADRARSSLQQGEPPGMSGDSSSLGKRESGRTSTLATTVHEEPPAAENSSG